MCLDDPSLPPDTVRARDGSVYHALKGLLVLLRRLKAPIDWDELQWEFGLTSNRLGQLFARMVFLMLNNHGHLLQGITMLGDPDHFAIFGDPAYSISNYLLRPHGGAWITARQEEFNLGMSRVRISVEWTFGKVYQLWEF